MSAELINCALNDFILINTMFKKNLFLDELTQNRKKAKKSVPKVKGQYDCALLCECTILLVPTTWTVGHVCKMQN